MNKVIVFLVSIVVFSGIGFAGDKKAASAIAPVVAVGDDDPICRPYVGAGIIYNRVYSLDSGWFNIHIDTQDETGGYALTAGCEFSKYFAIEARYTWTEWDQDYSDMTSYSLFLKPMYPITSNITVYGLAGYGNSKVVGSPGDPANDYQAWNQDIGRTMMDHNGFQWGFGAMYHITPSIALFGEFTMTAKDASIDPTHLYCYNQTTGCDYTTGSGGAGDDRWHDKLSTDGLTVGAIFKF